MLLSEDTSNILTSLRALLRRLLRPGPHPPVEAREVADSVGPSKVSEPSPEDRTKNSAEVIGCKSPDPWQDLDFAIESLRDYLKRLEAVHSATQTSSKLQRDRVSVNWPNDESGTQELTGNSATTISNRNCLTLACSPLELSLKDSPQAKATSAALDKLQANRLAILSAIEVSLMRTVGLWNVEPAERHDSTNPHIAQLRLADSSINPAYLTGEFLELYMALELLSRVEPNVIQTVCWEELYYLYGVASVVNPTHIRDEATKRRADERGLSYQTVLHNVDVLKSAMEYLDTEPNLPFPSMVATQNSTLGVPWEELQCEAPVVRRLYLTEGFHHVFASVAARVTMDGCDPDWPGLFYSCGVASQGSELPICPTTYTILLRCIYSWFDPTQRDYGFSSR